jgi:hypothetical protein
LEINPVLEALVDDDVSNEDSFNSERDQRNLHNQIANISTEQDEKLLGEIQTYEKRIQGLIEGVGMLKERVNKNIINKFF